MSFITLDFETTYSTKDKYSLRVMTYEQYIRDERFKVTGVGIKIDRQPTIWITASETEAYLRELFQPGNDHTLLCHNTMFDGAILSWFYGLEAKNYYCTQAMSRAVWNYASSSLDALAKRIFRDDESMRKGKELTTVDGVWEYNEQQEKDISGYCIQDVDLTFACFEQMLRFYPPSELELLDLTLKMFIHPAFVLDRPRVEKHLNALEKEQHEIVTAAAEEEFLTESLERFAQHFDEWSVAFCADKPFPPSSLRQSFPAYMKHTLGWKEKQLPMMVVEPITDKEKNANKLNLMWYALANSEIPDFIEAIAHKTLKKYKTEFEQWKAIFSSNDAFAAYINHVHGIEIPIKDSPTPKNPDNRTIALAKDDIPFLDIQREHQDLSHLWKARLNVSSTIEISRSERLLDHGQKSHINPNGMIAAPLNYAAAHTLRWGGTNKVNFQNFKRNSELRKSLMSPEGAKVVVADLSNIEGRMLAWFANQEELLHAFKNGDDIYSDFASDIFNRKVDRKRVEIHPETGEEFKPDETEGFVGKVCVLGLGYGMGWRTLQTTFAKGAMGGPQLFFDDEFCKRTVKQYRSKNYAISNSWKVAEYAIDAMSRPDMNPYTWGCLKIEYRRIRLPNGMYLNYPDLKPYEDEEERLRYHYWNGEFKKDIYGGLLIENIIQAISRIVMGEMMVQINNYLKGKGRVVLTVHDEIVAIVEDQYADEAFKGMLEIMSTPPAWCNDGTLALDAEGGIDTCYSK